MQKYLVSMKDNWADEIDVAGFEIWSHDEVEDFKKSVNQYFKDNCSLSIYVGTNEDIEYSNKESLLNVITFKEVSSDEAKLLVRFKITGSYGLDLYHIVELLADDGEY